ncbi:hypothetical protein P4O66_002827 [Electrophorus voltai]|uniref:Transmembrane protein 150A n=1 Tax=Electrophorus voltai TaxID=2609070 RepID=A0AAD8YV58_9TELE|nr:hypothetical protein P4O66_002827 [Electrophorus voltai]
MEPSITDYAYPWHFFMSTDSSPPRSDLWTLESILCQPVMVCMLRYAQVIEHNHQCWVNTSAMVSGCINAMGLIMVGSFQVDHAKSLHYVGAGVAFPAGLLFLFLQCVLTYRIAETALDYWMAHVRVALSPGALVSLILSIPTQTTLIHLGLTAF